MLRAHRTGTATRSRPWMPKDNIKIPLKISKFEIYSFIFEFYTLSASKRDTVLWVEKWTKQKYSSFKMNMHRFFLWKTFRRNVWRTEHGYGDCHLYIHGHRLFWLPQIRTRGVALWFNHPEFATFGPLFFGETHVRRCGFLELWASVLCANKPRLATARTSLLVRMLLPHLLWKNLSSNSGLLHM